MSILIPGMEMPKDCPMCPLAHWDFTGEFRGCKVVNGKKYAMETEPGYPETNFRPSWCPLVPVPPHGDLIDRDELRGAMFIGEQCIYAWDEIDDAIDSAPTIIPADPPVMYYPQVPGITPTVIAEEVYDKYTDTAGNIHWTGTHSGKHIIPADKEEKT